MIWLKILAVAGSLWAGAEDKQVMNEYMDAWNEYRSSNVSPVRLDKALEAAANRGWCFGDAGPTATWHWQRCQPSSFSPTLEAIQSELGEDQL
jgi:hypothetical protein